VKSYQRNMILVSRFQTIRASTGEKIKLSNDTCHQEWKLWLVETMTIIKSEMEQSIIPVPYK
jgi:hypothetical protein